MPTSRVSGNQIENTTNLNITGLDFAGNSGKLKLPTGTEAQRPASGAIGMIRFNTTEDRAEQYVINGPDNVPGWAKVKGGGGATGLGVYGLIKGNSRSIDENIDIPAISESYAFDNAFTVGPVITISSGYTVTVGEGVDWTIVETGFEPNTLGSGGFAGKIGPSWANIGSDDGIGEFNLIRGNSRTIDQNLVIPFNPSTNDYAFEESFSVGPTITITSGNTVTVSSGVTYEILDTSSLPPTGPTFNVSVDPTSVNEGDTFTTTITTTGVDDGTILYWEITGVSSDDFATAPIFPATTGQVIIASGTADFSHGLANDETTEGTETATIKFYSDSERTQQVGDTVTVTIADTSDTPPAAPPGQTQWTSAQTTSFTVPAGAFTISAVVVGGGGGGGGCIGNSGTGSGAGGGGGLSWGNFPTNPGETLTIRVGARGGGGNSNGSNGSPGGDSYIQRSGTNLLFAGGGGGGQGEASNNTGAGPGGTGASGTGAQGGGNGGRGSQAHNDASAQGGGGAGGYSGAGGVGGRSNTGTSGSGGAGSGGSGNNNYGGGGGGVGILGSGSSGTGGNGAGGSGGSNGGNGNGSSSQNGGDYGGGGGAAEDDTRDSGGDGGVGAVRILWGGGRSYPSNAGSV